MRRIYFITEYLNPPYDEGIKKTVFNLFNDLDKYYNIKALSRLAFEKENIRTIDTNALFISKEIKKSVEDFNPDVLIYFPFASSTFAGYLRMKVLSIFAKKKTKTILIALQPKPLKKWQQLLVRFIKPAIAITPSPALKLFWDKIKVKNQLIPLFTDLNIFKPIEKATDKNKLRNKYNLPVDSFIISHMGHFNEGRNLRSLMSLQQAGMQVIIVGSSSTPKDSLGPESLKEKLKKAGIIIFDGYIEHIEEIYQLSDAYIFPVVAQNSSIGMPLSILEARACGIPVITTDFGSIQKFLGDDDGGIFYSAPENFLKKLTEITTKKSRSFTKTKISKLNEKYFKTIFDAIDEHNVINE